MSLRCDLDLLGASWQARRRVPGVAGGAQRAATIERRDGPRMLATPPHERRVASSKRSASEPLRVGHAVLETGPPQQQHAIRVGATGHAELFDHGVGHRASRSGALVACTARYHFTTAPSWRSRDGGGLISRRRAIRRSDGPPSSGGDDPLPAAWPRGADASSHAWALRRASDPATRACASRRIHGPGNAPVRSGASANRRIKDTLCGAPDGGHLRDPPLKVLDQRP